MHFRTKEATNDNVSGFCSVLYGTICIVIILQLN
nr:MAG TPA: hypothetical protein [Caudoviricetes sp.]DAT22470.1 MAG TPA: hypothetical protein [Caudoviricetes sp.]DAX16011.1 MAG TPA: hypothetical protein [Caudoviricetes sp.]